MTAPGGPSSRLRSAEVIRHRAQVPRERGCRRTVARGCVSSWPGNASEVADEKLHTGRRGVVSHPVHPQRFAHELEMLVQAAPRELGAQARCFGEWHDVIAFSMPDEQRAVTESLRM